MAVYRVINEFGKTRRVRFGGELDIPHTGTHLSAGVENVQNLIYFDESSLPTQHRPNIQVFSATLDQHLRVGILNWHNTVTYQKNSDSHVSPPKRTRRVFPNSLLHIK